MRRYCFDMIGSIDDEVCIFAVFFFEQGLYSDFSLILVPSRDRSSMSSAIKIQFQVLGCLTTILAACSCIAAIYIIICCIRSKLYVDLNSVHLDRRVITCLLALERWILICLLYTIIDI